MSKVLTRFSPEELSRLCHDVLRLMTRRLESPSGSGDVDVKDLSLVWAAIAYNILMLYGKVNGVEAVDTLYRYMMKLFEEACEDVKEGGEQ